MTKIKEEAILWLQRKLMHCDDPYWSKVYEAAIEYATAPDSTRKIDQYYRQNLIRDAKIKMSRVSSWSQPLKTEIIPKSYINQAPLQEMHIVFLELEIILLSHIKDIHEYASRIYELSKLGFSTSETASILGLSSSYVRRIKAKIKAIAHQICLN